MDGYVKRSGADGSGRDYEIKITALLAIRCALRRDTQDVWLGSNLDQVGNFDDVVLFKESFDGTLTAYLIQLKHSDLPKNIKQKEFTSGAKGASKDFYLGKYYDEYTKLKSKILEPNDDETLIIKDLRKAHKIVFLLYTNRGVNSCELIEEFSDDGFRFLNSGVKDVVYKFKGFSNYGTFLDDLFLFTDQAHLNETERLMANEIKSILGTNFLNNDDLNVFVDRFVTFIRLWSKDRTFCQPLTKMDILNQITDLLLLNFKINLSKELYTCYNSETKYIWNELVSEKWMTIIDFSDEVLEFVVAYVGSEVRGYYNKTLKYWSDIVKDAQKLLLDDNVKVIDIRNSLTLLDVYRYLWFSNRVPLLLQVESNDDYRNILRVLKLSGYTKRVIILTKSDITAVVKQEKGKYFLGLTDLNNKQLDSVVQLPVKLQGRGPIPLIEIIDESMHNLVKSRDIIGILGGTYTIGDYYRDLPDFFIERYIPRIFMKHNILVETDDGEVYLIEGDSSHITPKENTIFVSSWQEALLKLPELLEEHSLIHWLKDDHHLEWIQSFGQTTRLDNFSYTLPNLTRSVNDVHSTVNILSASPGMGKSVLLDYIAQNVPTDKWVLRINLAEFEDKEFDDVLESAVNDSKCNTELARRVFEKMKSTYSVIVLLDGFDEVSLNLQNAALRFAKAVVDEGYSMWITTRPFMKQKLEKAFGTLALTLVPFTLDDQKNFLTKYFGQISNEPEHQTILHNFVDELLEAGQRNLHDWDYEFTGIPLQTKLLADVFYADCQQSFAMGVVSFNKNFNLIYLYEEFVKKKLSIMTEKFGRTAVEMRVLFEHQQKLFALSTVFPKVYLQTLDIDQKLKEFLHDDQYKMQFMQREGIVVVDSSTVKFVHRTFAEYLAAQWLSENTDNKELLQLRFLSQYTFLFNLLDRILAKNNPLHSAVINLKVPEALKIIRAKPESVKRVDACGRNVVHLVALYGFHHKAYNHYESITEPLLDLLKSIRTVDKLARVPDKALLYTPLEYAVASWSLAIANFLSQYNSTINAEIDHYRKDAYFAHCANLGYTPLFHILLMYFSAREILFIRNTNEDSLASQFFLSSNVGSRDHESISLLAKDIYQRPLKELFKHKYVETNTNVPDFYYDLRFASAYGTKDNVQYLLDKGSEINKQDVDKNTSLHYACINNKLENVKVLLQNCAKINLLNVNNNSPLHYAIRRCYPEISEYLLKNGANPNFQNRNQFTALHFVFTCGHEKSLIELMIKCGADPNLQNNKLNTGLHYASQMGYTDILIELINRGGNVNILNYNNESPLFFAVRFGHEDTALVLLSKGADISFRNKDGQTVLNIAAEKGRRELVVAFIARGADINNTDIDKDSPLNDALKNNHFDVAKVLVESGADGNISNNDGYCALHYVAGVDTALLHEILKSADVNAKTVTGDTALHLALSNNKISNALELLHKGADVNIVNSVGNSPLHIAAFLGDTQIVALILEKCVNCDKPNFNGDTPLHIALKKRHIDCGNLLVSNCDINMLNDEGTALHYAVKKSNVAIVSFLLDNGAQTNVRNNAGKTPLHVAVTDLLHDSNPDIEGGVTIIQLLLNAGTEVNAQDDLGNTALYYIATLNTIFISEEIRKEVCKRISQMLVDKGADVNLVNNRGHSAFGKRPRQNSCRTS
ncbi:hypothetical protein RN001_010934 [Aquatica leii]|uniref:NACHT domain-containing protein n=1 Tax=Aquatica leii TaxID=1421715 RepID=A0AAN7SNH5_9COLE|nr:hypothetical protein RN001_010934 [Aquatica leii]